MRVTATLTLIAAVVCGPTAIAAEAASTPDPSLDRFEAMDVFDLEWADGPRVAPDGGTVAYVRHGFDVMKDRPTARIWLARPDGGFHRPLTDRDGRSPRWSPSGDRIAFLSSTDEGVEVYMHWLADGRTTRITQLPESPRGLTWSPDGGRLAFSMFVENDAEPMAKMPKAPEDADWAPAAKVIEQVTYRADAEGYLRQGFDQVFVLPAEGGTARQVTRGTYHHDGGIAWAADGRSLFVSANRRDDWEYERSDSAIHQVNLDTGEIRQLTRRYGPESSPMLSPDGRLLAFTGYEDRRLSYHNSVLSVLDLASGEVRELTGDLDRSVAGPVWDQRGRGLYVTYDEHGNGVIAHVPLGGGNRRVVAEQLGGTAIGRPYSGGSFHAAAGTVAYTYSQPARPAELALANDGGEARLLTQLNEDALGHQDLAAVERFTFASSAGEREVEAWVAKPPGFQPGRRYPLILEIHGGPFAAYGPHFAAEIQRYAAEGYVVVYVNPRGSTSYGAEFANLIHQDYPGDDYHDLMSAVDHAVEAGWADPEQLYVTGGSGGGILTAWIVTHTDRFRAAVSQKPVINWYSMALTTDFYVSLVPYWFAEQPWESPEEYLRRSPLHHVAKASTPTMLITGEQDFRTPITEAEQFYQALKLNRVDTALVRIPEASHGIAARPSHLVAKVEHVLAWFERYAPSPSSASPPLPGGAR